MAEYGPRLSEKEYGKLLVELHSDLPPVPTRRQREKVLRRELDLEIDYRLGSAFPLPRREKLWVIHRKVMRKQRRMWFGHVLRALTRRTRQPDADRLASWLVDQYRQELSEPELVAFFGAEMVEHPALPTLEEPDK